MLRKCVDHIFPKKTLGITRVKNEQDIIEPFVRANAPYLQHFVIIDNNSLDDTLSILKQLTAEFPQLIVESDFETVYKQREITTKLYHCFQQQFLADFIVFLDADEFLSFKEPNTFTLEKFYQELDHIPPHHIGMVPWVTHVYREPEKTFWKRQRKLDIPNDMPWRRAVESPQYYKAILRLDGAFNENLIISQGSHTVFLGESKLPSVELPSLCLRHYPVRNRQQVVAKAFFGCLALKRWEKYSKGISYQWFAILDRLKKGLITEKDLQDISYHYAQAGQPENEVNLRFDNNRYAYIRKYSKAKSMDPLMLLARAIERDEI